MYIIKTIKGDITKPLGVQAIVNAANTLLLANCYYNSMQVAMDNGIRTIAFPSISTGVYLIPVNMAAKIAVSTVAGFLGVNEDKFDLVEWVLFDDNTEKVYAAEVDKLYK